MVNINSVPEVPNFEELIVEEETKGPCFAFPRRAYPSVHFLKYKRSDSSLDWNYPFDFCGSIYKLSNILHVIDAIQVKSKLEKPNTFEFAGNQALSLNKDLLKDMDCCLCLNMPVMTVVTVNKVQDIYNTPVYEFKSEESKDGDDVLEVMNKYYESGRQFDIAFYRD